MVKSYIKIYGPPVAEAIKALEKISIDMGEVCIMDTYLSQMDPTDFSSPDNVYGYFITVGDIEYKRCSNIISKSGESLGDYDFFFEWFQEPNMEQLHGLIEKIDEALHPLGCKYTITTK